MCEHYENINEEHRHYVESSEFNNCVLCLADAKGPMTQPEIAQFIGLTKMRICQIEKMAIKKFKRICKARGIDIENIARDELSNFFDYGESENFNLKTGNRRKMFLKLIKERKSILKNCEIIDL